MWRHVLEFLAATLILQHFWNGQVESARILLSGVLGEGSHFMALVPIGRSLVQKGHNVTFLISQEYSFRASDPELTRLFDFEIFSFNDPNIKVNEFLDGFAEIGFKGSGGILQLAKSCNLGKRILRDGCESVLENEALMGRLADMDAIVLELPWPCGIFIKSYLDRHSPSSNVRVILSSATAPVGVMFKAAGSPINPAYQPAMYSTFTSSMNFFERLRNSLFTVFLNTLLDFFLWNTYSGTVNKFDLHPNLASIDGVKDHIDLFLTNCDFAVEFPFPLMPNVIPVGGLTAQPAKPLQPDLEEFVQSSGDYGIVVFAMGSYFASFASHRPDIFKMFLDAFARIPQKVIMQIKGLPPYPLPENVKGMSWLPQNDLLGHPKTRAFVSHAGNNGYMEALYHGVPMLVIPIFGDHIDVTVRVVSRGIGVKIEKDNLSTDLIYQNLVKILTDPKYNATVKRLSAIFRDRPMTPADRAAFWIEHVIKHGGKYMRSPANDLSFIQYNMIDVYAFLLLGAGVMLYITYRLLIKCKSLITPAPKPKIE